MLYYLHFLHAHDTAYLLRYMYTSIAYERVEDTRIHQVFKAVLFKKEPGGIDDGEHEPSKELASYDDVCLIHNRFAGVPVCVLNSVAMRITAGKVNIERVTFNAHMITKIVEYVVNEEHWPPHMTKDEKLAAAVFDYSMRAMDLFTARVPLRLSDPATWIIYDLPMLAHGFVAYMLEIYLVTAVELGALDVVKAFFKGFARGDGDVFDLTNGYGICDILLSLDDETFPILNSDTVDEQLGWALDLLGDLLNVPELVTVDVLPEFVASPIGGVSDLFVAPSPLPPSASNTPLSALLTIAEVDTLLMTPDRLTPRRLRF